MVNNDERPPSKSIIYSTTRRIFTTLISLGRIPLQSSGNTGLASICFIRSVGLCRRYPIR